MVNAFSSYDTVNGVLNAIADYVKWNGTVNGLFVEWPKNTITYLDSSAGSKEVNQEISDTDGEWIHLGCGGELEIIKSLIRDNDPDQEVYGSRVRCKDCGAQGTVWND